jgi:hypothetical protein
MCRARAGRRPSQTSARSLRTKPVCATYLLRGCALFQGALAFRRFDHGSRQGFDLLTQLQAMLPGIGSEAGVTCLTGTQCSGSTPRLGRSTEGNDARSRSGADCEPARKHRTRSTLRIASGMRPSMSEIPRLVSETGTIVKNRLSKGDADKSRRRARVCANARLSWRRRIELVALNWPRTARTCRRDKRTAPSSTRSARRRIWRQPNAGAQARPRCASR